MWVQSWGLEDRVWVTDFSSEYSPNMSLIRPPATFPAGAGKVAGWPEDFVLKTVKCHCTKYAARKVGNPNPIFKPQDCPTTQQSYWY